MKRVISFLIFSLFFLKGFGQYDLEIGYNATDIGGEFQWYPAGTVVGLHLGFNAKVHHSMQVGLGYNKSNRKSWGEHQEEKGSGWGGHLGYRYYFKPFPHKFFIGCRTDIWRMDIDWKDGSQSGNSKTWTLQPVLEIGYTFFINDQAFLTPSFSNGAAINLKTDGQDVGQGFITMIGVSAGIRL